MKALHPRPPGHASGDGYTLADVAARTATIALACNRCPRAGRYRVATLIQRFGPDCNDFTDRLSADCPRRQEAASIYERCGAHCPTLSAVFLP